MKGFKQKLEDELKSNMEKELRFEQMWFRLYVQLNDDLWRQLYIQFRDGLWFHLDVQLKKEFK